MTKERYAAGSFFLYGQLFRLRRNLVKAKPGNGRQLLRRVQRILPSGDSFLEAAGAGGFRGSPAGADGAKPSGLLCLALLSYGVGGQCQNPAVMRIL